MGLENIMQLSQLIAWEIILLPKQRKRKFQLKQRK